jgi:hypothetical protein
LANFRFLRICAVTLSGVALVMGLSTEALRGAAPKDPGVPSLVSPANGATNIAANPTLAWSASNSTSYDVYFGKQNPPALVAATLKATSYATTTQPGTIYYWKIVSKNKFGTTAGPLSTFTTAASAPPPQPPPPGSLAITCPANQSVTAQTTSGIAVSYPPFTVSGGTAPISVVSQPASGSVFPVGVTTVSATATDALLKQASCTFTVTVSAPPAGQPIWGVTASDILGTCSAAIHDKYVLDGGDGYLYRTWHPLQDPSGCTFGHEHGDDPKSSQNAEIAARPVLFGYIGRRMPTPAEPNGHEEPHEGFKVFVANVGDVNDEGRINRVYSRSAFHMGTGGPKRFSMQHHSADIALVHPEFGLKAFTRLMMDTGGSHTVCDPRAPTPTKDVISLASPCKLNSPYEIWGTTQTVQYQGQVVYRSFATPATFDPVTVFNPSNPTEQVYAWDPRVALIKNFPNDDWSYFRGCRRESYAQPGYWYNQTALTQFPTDAMGNQLPATDPLVIMQTISRSSSVNAPATNDGLSAFKMRRNYCGSGLGLKN